MGALEFVGAAAVVLTKRRHTFEDWLALPDDGKRYELLNGELVGMPPPTANHALIVRVLYRWLGRADEAGHGIVLTAPVADLFRNLRPL